MNNKTKLLGIIMIIFFFTQFILVDNVQAVEENRLDIKVEAGINGKAKMEQGLPVTLTITNNKEDFSGDLVITIPKNYQSIGDTIIPIDIASGATKTIKFSLPGMIGMDVLRQGPSQAKVQQFHLYEGDWKDGKEVKIDSKLEITPTYVQQNQLIIGVLSERPDSLNYLKLTSLVGNTPEMLVLDEEDLPSEAVGYEVFDLLVINDYAIAKLPVDIQKTIVEWVHDGGTLVVGSEPGMEQQLGELSELLPLSITGKETVQTIESYAEFSENGIEVDNLEIFTGDLKDQATVQFDEHGIPLVMELNAGKGTVTQFSYDLGHPSFSDWKGNEMLWQAIVNQITVNMNQNMQQQGYVMGEDLVSIANQFATLANFELPTLVLLFVVYLLVIIPILFFVLKKMDKREWAWVVIPVIAVISSIGLYATGAKDRLGSIQASSASIISINEQGVGGGEGAISMLSQDSGSYILNVNKSLHPFPSNGSYSGEMSTVNRPVIETDGDIQNLHYLDVEFWSPRSASIDIPTQQYGYFEADLQIKDGAIKGNLTNKFAYDFEDVYLLSGQKYEKIGKLEANETKKIKMSTSKNQLFQSPGPDLAYQMFGAQNGSMNQMSEDQKKIELLSNAIRNHMYAADNTPILIGFTNQQLVKINVNDKETDQTNLNLFTQPVTIDLPTGEESFSTDLTMPELSAQNGIIHYNGLLDGEPFFDAESGTYLLTYRFPEAFINKQFVLNELDIKLKQPAAGLAYNIYNNETGEYEPLNKNLVTLDQDADVKYVKDNAIVLKVVSSMGTGIEVPVVTIEGGIGQ
ncbi:hypothetical protein [Aquibacillus kalidii]|uniref:hypothetical protein n=1 Tax=Aquibacillus kalidii TaxID=2762597 RepID=UPI001646E6F3|nr:hypothetical protein [Aquibacillus kalidii]